MFGCCTHNGCLIMSNASLGTKGRSWTLVVLLLFSQNFCFVFPCFFSNPRFLVVLYMFWLFFLKLPMFFSSKFLVNLINISIYIPSTYFMHINLVFVELPFSFLVIKHFQYYCSHLCILPYVSWALTWFWLWSLNNLHVLVIRWLQLQFFFKNSRITIVPSRCFGSRTHTYKFSFLTSFEWLLFCLN
jgi:hypothetical protein